MTSGGLRAALPLVAVACASSPPKATPTAAAAPQEITLVAPRLRIVPAADGAARSLRSEPVMIPFGVNQNGTELVYALLERAATGGASFVGDLAITMTFRWRGHTIECRTDVLPEGDPRLAPPAPAAATPAGDTEIAPFSPQPLDLIVDDRELVCTPYVAAVPKKRRVNQSVRDATSGRLADPNPRAKEVVMVKEKRERCEWRQLTRRTTRHDYEVKLGFVPPNLEHLAARFSDRHLVAARPKCYAIAEEQLATTPAYRATATAYHRGKVAMTISADLPSRGPLDDMAVRMADPRECAKITLGSRSADPEGSRLCRPAELEKYRRSRFDFLLPEKDDDVDDGIEDE